MVLLQDSVVLDEFESAKPSDQWVFKDSRGVMLREGVKQGTGALSWETPAKGSVSTHAIPKNWAKFSRVCFWARCSEDRTIDVIVAPEKGPARFWRMVAIAAGPWQRVEIPLYQFRTDDVPSWTDVARLEISAREGEATIHLDDLRLIAAKEGDIPQVEPDEPLIARAFGPDAKNVQTKKTANFRLFTNAPVDVEKIGKALEEFHQLFRKTFRLGEGNLDYPATLVIQSARPEYTRFASRTALDIYGGILEEKSIRSDGYTFENYSLSFYLEKYGEMRPVFYHEVCHQLVTRYLKLRGPRGASWAEEGLCYFMQNEFLKQEGLNDQIQMMMSNPRRTGLDKFTVALAPAGAVNLQSMLLMAFAAKGPHKDSHAAFLGALRDGVNLKKAVEEGLKVSMEDFQKGWEEFCREAYK